MAQFKDKHRTTIYNQQGEELFASAYEINTKVEGFSTKTGKASRRPLTFVVSADEAGKKRFTRKASPWWRFW